MSTTEQSTPISATLSPLPVENVLISTAGISQYTGFAKQTHNRWRFEGTGPKYIKIGRKVLYFSDDVRAWMQSFYQTGEQRDMELNQSDTRLDVSKYKR